MKLIKAFEKWVDSMWQDDSHPVDDEDIKNIFSDYLDHFSLHNGFEVIKQFTGEHLNKYVFLARYIQNNYDELLSRKHILVRIKAVLSDDVGYEEVQDSKNRYCKKKYIDDASDIILDIANRMEDIGYSLSYPDIKIFGAQAGGLARHKEIVFRFTMMDSMAKRYHNRGEFGGYAATLKKENHNKIILGLDDEDVKNIFTDFLDEFGLQGSEFKINQFDKNTSVMIKYHSPLLTSMNKNDKRGEFMRLLYFGLGKQGLVFGKEEFREYTDIIEDISDRMIDLGYELDDVDFMPLATGSYLTFHFKKIKLSL